MTDILPVLVRPTARLRWLIGGLSVRIDSTHAAGVWIDVALRAVVVHSGVVWVGRVARRDVGSVLCDVPAAEMALSKSSGCEQCARNGDHLFHGVFLTPEGAQQVSLLANLSLRGFALRLGTLLRLEEVGLRTAGGGDES